MNRINGEFLNSFLFLLFGVFSVFLTSVVAFKFRNESRKVSTFKSIPFFLSVLEEKNKEDGEGQWKEGWGGVARGEESPNSEQRKFCWFTRKSDIQTI